VTDLEAGVAARDAATAPAGDAGPRVAQQARGIRVRKSRRRHDPDAGRINGLLDHLHAQHVFDIVRYRVEPGHAYAGRAREHLLLAPENPAKRAHAAAEFLELARAPRRGQADQVAGAISHQRHEVVPERSADDFIQALRGAHRH